MFLSAVEGFAIERAQTAAVQALIERLRSSLAILGDARHPTGAAALIDSVQNLFVAHADAVSGDTIQARIGDGTFRLKVLNRDSRTELVLLAAASGERIVGPAIAIADENPQPGSRVLVLLADSAVVGSFVGGQRFSIVGEKKQAVPVSEIRFESMPRNVSGALLISLDGKLLGSVRATVVRQEYDAMRQNVQSTSQIQALGQGNARMQDFSPKQFKNVFGPATLTVAYSPSLTIVKRAVSGFLTNEHKAEYAALGIQVADNLGGGALVKSVFPDSPAGRIGVRKGDILLQMGPYSIVRQYDFVNALLEFRPGDRTVLKLKRDGNDVQMEVLLARSTG